MPGITAVSAADCHVATSQTSTLLTIPPEMRNVIYELVFSVDRRGLVDLIDSAPPSKSILLTCREIYTEAAKMHKHAYQDYWRSTPFSLATKRLPPSSWDVNFSLQELSKVRYLSFTADIVVMRRMLGDEITHGHLPAASPESCCVERWTYTRFAGPDRFWRCTAVNGTAREIEGDEDAVPLFAHLHFGLHGVQDKRGPDVFQSITRSEIESILGFQVLLRAAALDSPANPSAVQTSKLLTIAAELRNNIHELVFTLKAGPVHIFYAEPPSAALVHTCRQTRKEALQMYRSSERRYWQDTIFDMSPRAWASSLRKPIRVNFTLDNLESMRNLQFMVPAQYLRHQLGAETVTATHYAANSTYTFKRHGVGEWVCYEIDGVAVPAGKGYPVLFVWDERVIADEDCDSSRALRAASSMVLMPLTRRELSILLGYEVELR
ncbi:hypothetical protein LTR56_021526 [Elasticomyces elasticus]|nr:hypothetical protein LTR56_021526 [Elasticomyces elasticus]KAK3631265.1 hypothetical protein LTR22_021149 [Elasticomyces elasticus]KAK4909354.1 hypothetical protein LTR49_021866 [Elasticomyces elasticus]KAK5749382.1 hypothetical protein LTS12_020563 [Elasticomyces elasticus]